MEHKEIRDLINLIAETGVTQVRIKTDQIDIRIENQPGFQIPEMINYAPFPETQNTLPQIASTPQETKAAPALGKSANEEDNFLKITSPMIGTFYRKPSPDKDVFVKVGDTIKAGDTVCIIEAMKLFNEIEAEVSGKIMKILVDDSTPVEYDQPLFLIDPNA